MWNRAELDFRVMISFKNRLFESPDLDKENCIPLSEFRRIRSEHDNGKIKQLIANTEDLVIREISVGNSGLVNLDKYSDLIDLFVYMPNKEKTAAMHESPAIHYILSSNMKGKATAEKSDLPRDEVHLRRMLEFCWIRIQERF